MASTYRLFTQLKGKISNNSYLFFYSHLPLVIAIQYPVCLFLSRSFLEIKSSGSQEVMHFMFGICWDFMNGYSHEEHTKTILTAPEENKQTVKQKPVVLLLNIDILYVRNIRECTFGEYALSCHWICSNSQKLISMQIRRKRLSESFNPNTMLHNLVNDQWDTELSHHFMLQDWTHDFKFWKWQLKFTWLKLTNLSNYTDLIITKQFI